MWSSIVANEEQKRRGYEEEQKGFAQGWGGGVISLLKRASVGCLLTFWKGPEASIFLSVHFDGGSQRKKKEIFCLVTDCWSSQHIWKNRIIKVNIPVEFPFITREIYSILIRNPVKASSTQGKKFKSSGQRFEFWRNLRKADTSRSTWAALRVP